MTAALIEKWTQGRCHHRPLDQIPGAPVVRRSLGLRRALSRTSERRGSPLRGSSGTRHPPGISPGCGIATTLAFSHRESELRPGTRIPTVRRTAMRPLLISALVLPDPVAYHVPHSVPLRLTRDDRRDPRTALDGHCLTGQHRELLLESPNGRRHSFSRRERARISIECEVSRSQLLQRIACDAVEVEVTRGSFTLASTTGGLPDGPIGAAAIIPIDARCPPSS